MSFKTLEQRFLESSATIYNRLDNNQAFAPIKPDSPASRSRIKDDSRLLPALSTVRDVAFVSKLLTTSNGLLFLAKQTLLQTGNAFAETRLYNPASPLLNAVPALFLVRHFGRPFGNLKTPTRENRGALQEETITTLSNKQNSPFTNLTSPFKALSVKPKTVAERFGIDSPNYYVRPEDVFFKEGNYFAARLFDIQDIKSRGDKKTLRVAQPSINIEGLDGKFTRIWDISSGNKPTLISSFREITIPNKTKNPETDSYVKLIQQYDLKKTSVFNLNSNKRTDPIIADADVVHPPSKDINSRYSPSPPSGVKPKLYPIQTAVENSYSNTLQVALDEGKLFSASAFYKVFIGTGSTFPVYTDQAIAFKWAKYKKYNPYDFDEFSTQTTDAFTQQNENYRESAMPVLFPKAGNVKYSGIPDYGYLPGGSDPINKATPTNNNIPTASRTIYTSIIGDRTAQNLGLADLSYAPNDQIENKPDIIKFIFKNSSGGDPVHFRAFINSLKENVKPEYNEQRYIGRTERFVTYAGVKRTANLDFNIVAFSQSEIKNVWTKVNYLTGLAFPKGVSTSGFMIPPLFRLTIGNIYGDQPVYIDSLEYDFLDEQYTTFDVDYEVSQMIKVTMGITLLEKRSRFYDSPFYQITNAPY